MYTGERNLTPGLSWGRVSGITILSGGVVLVQRRTKAGVYVSDNTPKRGKIRYLSNRSRMRLAVLAQTTPVNLVSMITLTYPREYPSDGKKTKLHLNHYITRMRQHFGSFDYIWCLEFQARGAPHIHIVTSLNEPSDNNRDYHARCWVDCISPREREASKVYRVHKHPKSWERVKCKDGARHYIVKYATKTNQKLVPSGYTDVGRWWGCSRSVKPGEPLQYVDISERELRQVLDSLGHPAGSYERLPRALFGLQFKPKGEQDVDKHALWGALMSAYQGKNLDNNLTNDHD